MLNKFSDAEIFSSRKHEKSQEHWHLRAETHYTRLDASLSTLAEFGKSVSVVMFEDTCLV